MQNYETLMMFLCHLNTAVLIQRNIKWRSHQQISKYSELLIRKKKMLKAFCYFNVIYRDWSNVGETNESAFVCVLLILTASTCEWWLLEASHSISAPANQVPVAYLPLLLAVTVVSLDDFGDSVICRLLASGAAKNPSCWLLSNRTLWVNHRLQNDLSLNSSVSTPIIHLHRLHFLKINTFVTIIAKAMVTMT